MNKEKISEIEVVGAISQCPLCGSCESREIARIDAEQVFTSLKLIWEIDLPAAVRSPYAHREFLLDECGRCKLQYFRDLPTGTAEFYAACSQSEKYYNKDPKWEFDKTLQMLKGQGRKKILDVGCGNGIFCSMAAKEHEVAGLEYNSEMVRFCREKGLSVEPASLEEFSATRENSFDVLTAFHVLEHVSNPCGFVRDGKKLLRRGGLFFLALPNRRAQFVDIPLEESPLDCPPHHATRWDFPQMRFLAEKCDMRCIAMFADFCFNDTNLLRNGLANAGFPLLSKSEAVRKLLVNRLTLDFLKPFAIPLRFVPKFSMLCVFQK